MTSGGPMGYPRPRSEPAESQGLYDPAFEHDACGVAFVADMHGRRSHDVVSKGLFALLRMDHRGARLAEPNTGDVAGIMIQIPDAFLRDVVPFALPPAGQYATGLVFLPTDDAAAERGMRVLEKFALVEGAEVLGWREVPTDPTDLGATALAAIPRIVQVFVSAVKLGSPEQAVSGLDLDRVRDSVGKPAERGARQRGSTPALPAVASRP